MKHFDTLIETIEYYKSIGYTSEFLVKDSKFLMRDTLKAIPPLVFEVNFIHRFEGDTDPNDGSILYVIQNKTLEIKGLLINGYGIYADLEVAEIMILLSKKFNSK